jgi:RNA polymerase sigma factor (sigma-70 family)
VIDRARHLRRVTIKSLETVTEPNVSDDQDERLAYEEMRSAVEKSLKKMDTRYSEVFVLKRETGMTYSEIGKILNLSERTVKRRMKNALLILTGDLTSAGFFALLSILMAFAAGLYVILIKGKP